jgi:uncharacterized protein with von Willebrand factor type A (vWA) domain
MATLRRSCHRLLWIDPLAALPQVDELVPAASVASLEELAARLGSL